MGIMGGDELDPLQLVQIFIVIINHHLQLKFAKEDNNLKSEIWL